MTTSEKIKVLLKRAGKTQKQLCKDIGISENGLTNMLESNKFKTDTLNAIAKSLKTTTDYLMSDKLESDSSIVNEPQLHYQTEIFYLKQLVKKQEEIIEMLKSKIPDKLTNENKALSKKEIKL